jgi:hypothetical protein
MKSLGKMLTMSALVAVSFVKVANAAQLIVFEAPLDNWKKVVSADFVANRELGRAWIDVQVEWSNSIGEEPAEREVTSKAVEGLYYDSARKQVLYRTATETVVCAEDATFLWSTYLKSTGQCLLTPRTEQHKVDDGFKIREQTVAKVVFEAQTSSASQPAAASQELTGQSTLGK